MWRIFCEHTFFFFILLISTLSLVNRPYSDPLFCFLQNLHLLSRVTVLFYILMIWLWLVSVLSESESSIFTIFGSIYSVRSEEIVPYFILHSSGDSVELFHTQLISYLLWWDVCSCFSAVFKILLFVFVLSIEFWDFWWFFR